MGQRSVDWFFIFSETRSFNANPFSPSSATADQQMKQRNTRCCGNNTERVNWFLGTPHFRKPRTWFVLRAAVWRFKPLNPSLAVVVDHSFMNETASTQLPPSILGNLFIFSAALSKQQHKGRVVFFSSQLKTDLSATPFHPLHHSFIGYSCAITCLFTLTFAWLYIDLSPLSEWLLFHIPQTVVFAADKLFLLFIKVRCLSWSLPFGQEKPHSVLNTSCLGLPWNNQGLFSVC